MALLQEPMEYIDLRPGASAAYRVEYTQDGEAVIHPHVVTQRHVRQHMDQRGLTEPPVQGTPISVQVPVLRLYGKRLDKAESQTYYDVSSKTLRADLLARFSDGRNLPATIMLTANGVRPNKRYSVEVLT